MTLDSEDFVSSLVDIRETGEKYQIIADIPGIAREDIQIRVENESLSFHGQRAYAAQVSDNEVWHYKERPLKFGRRFRLPKDVNMDKITAVAADGILVIDLPKMDFAKENKKNVRVSGVSSSRLRSLL